LFSGISYEMLVKEVKTYSNNVLKDLMIEKLLKKIIQGLINTINHLDMTSETILRIRKDLKDFFTELSKWTWILKNLGAMIKSDYDKNHLIVYDEIMETVNSV
jgi:hypothetical protein